MQEVLNTKQNSRKFLEFSKLFAYLKNPHNLFYYFLVLVLTGILFFITSLAVNKFTTPFTGDYVSQQYAFYNNVYDDWWHFVKTGSFQYFDFNTYLGVNNIGSNSFYSLFDPFFFMCMFFPRDFLPQAMAISSILRMSFNGLIFYAYLRLMGITSRSAKIAGMAFAYSGWTAWYLWFNCYTENCFTLILIFIGVEKVLRNKKPWFLMFALFAAGLTNYFFLVAFTIIGFIYAMYRFFQRLKLNSWQDNLWILLYGFIGFLGGLLLCCSVLLPSLMVAKDAPRASSDGYLENILNSLKNFKIKELFSYLFSWKNVDNGLTYRHYFPIIEFFYPVMSDRGTPLMNYASGTYDNVAGSLFTYFPFIIFLVPALISATKKKNYWPLATTAIFLLMLFTPFSYYLFFGFTKPYSRWYVFVITSLLTFVSKYLDNVENEPKWTIAIGGGFALFGALGSAGLASYIINNSSSFAQRYPLSKIVPLECLYIVVLTLLIYFFLNKKFFRHVLLTAILFESAIMGALTIDGHGVYPYNEVCYGMALNHSLSSLTSKVNASDKTYFRAASSLIGDSNKNDGAANGYNGVSYFHSLYNFNVNNFTYWSMFMISRSGWSGKYVEKREGLDKFLGLKYYYIEKDRLLYEDTPDHYESLSNFSPDFKDVSNEYPNKDYYVFRDEDPLNFAFSLDKVTAYEDERGKDLIANTMGSYAASSAWMALRNENYYLSTALLSYEDAMEVMEKYPSLNEKLIQAPFGTDSYQKKLSIYHGFFKLGQTAKNMSISEIIDKLNTISAMPYRPTGNEALDIVSVIQPVDGFPYDPEGMTFYLDAPYLKNCKANIYFIGADDNVITWDNHGDDRNTDSQARRGPRAFYINKNPMTGVAPTVSKIIVVHRYMGFNNINSIAYESRSSFNARYAALKANAVTDVYFSDNHFNFKTNYTTNRFVVTQVAYDAGWKVKAKQADGSYKNVKTYLTQGGFVGFVSEVGDTYYTMDYETPYLFEGKILSVLGGTLFFGTLFSYLYIEEMKKEKREFHPLES